MREILFRGKTEQGTWIYGNYLYSQTDKRYFINGDSVDYGYQRMEVISETVGQYTGITDRNGVKIFEGDIVIATVRDDYYNGDYSMPQGFHFKGNIIWKSGGYWINKGNESHYLGWNEFEIEVIGNIHDNNPELLEQ